MTVEFGVDQLCRFCKGTGEARGRSVVVNRVQVTLTDTCLHCNGSKFEPSQKAVARRSDPETSREAAASISAERLRNSQQIILNTLLRYGPMTDEDVYRRTATTMSPSGARTRRAELVARGLVYDTGKRETLASGRKAVVWGAR